MIRVTRRHGAIAVPLCESLLIVNVPTWLVPLTSKIVFSSAFIVIAVHYVEAGCSSRGLKIILSTYTLLQGTFPVLL